MKHELPFIIAQKMDCAIYSDERLSEIILLSLFNSRMRKEEREERRMGGSKRGKERGREGGKEYK